MALNYERILSYVNDYDKLKTDFQPLISLLKASLDNKQRVSVDVGDSVGRRYCSVLTAILGDSSQTGSDTALATVDVICDCLTQQVTSANVRWYFLEKCQLLYCLTRRFLAFSNPLIKIKIAKTLQNYLIYSPVEAKSLLSEEIVSELLKQLVNILRGSHPQDFSEALLGLLASLCQIWSQCQDVMNVIDDYQVLRKQLLRFLSAEMVKRTTIVYTMTIMFHLCNSDDRLFNKRNIRQTLQVLFNIMLNGDTGWASLYAANLLTEICKSSRTSHLLTEYRSLPLSLKETIYQLNTKDKITTEKYFEFILTIVSINSEYQHMVMDIIITNESNNDNIWEKEYNDHSLNGEPLDSIIQLVNSSDMTISIYSTRLLNEIYMELLFARKVTKLPKLNLIGETVHQFLATATSSSILKFNKFISEDKNDHESCSIEQSIRHRQQISILLKIKHIMEFVTDLLKSGDQWIDQAISLISFTDKIIRDQLESNPLMDDETMSKDQMLYKLSSLGVDVFIDLLYFYYRATEMKISSNPFNERLKAHLEQVNCPTMLAFALSAACQNQTTLQRALVLQGVCLHIQNFNIETMGEKMYKFSTQFSSLKSENNKINRQLINKHCASPTKSHLLVEAADGDTGAQVNTNHSALSVSSDNNSAPLFIGHSENNTAQILRSNLNRKGPLDHGFFEDNNFKTELSKCQYSKSPIVDNASQDHMDKMSLDLKVQQIVKRWMEKPEMSFSTAEIYAIFEHRIQSMQTQEALMDEIISNKTAALHQSEALLNQYRSKLNDAEKESKQLRNLQVETETKIDALLCKIEVQKDKIIEMEKINQTLIETNRMSEKQKEDCLSISKKLQEKLVKLSDEKAAVENSLENYCKLLEEAQKQISLKDNQITNYTQMTKLINKLTGNKFSFESPLDHQVIDELNKSNSSMKNEFECFQTLNNSMSGNICANNNNNTSPSLLDIGASKLHKRTISSNDFLHLYKTNCRILQSHR